MRFYVDWNHLYNKNGLSDTNFIEFEDFGD